MKAKIFILMLLVTISLGAVEVGETVDSFVATSDSDEMWSPDSSEHDYLVVYFYPAAMTFGCTKQACKYRDHKTEFDALNAEIIGVSGDDVSSLQTFKKANNLNFTLLSDKNGNIAKIFGVPISDGGEIEKKIDGKKVTLTRGVTTKRWTFILNTKNEVIYKDDSVNFLADTKNVLKKLKQDLPE